MAIPLAGMFMPALAKVGAAKLPLLLRAAGITAGAAPSLMRGDLGGAVVGGGLGALGTLGLGNLQLEWQQNQHLKEYFLQEQKQV